MSARTSSSQNTWRLATGLAFAALLCAILLGGVSAWFLGSVAIAGLSSAAFTFNFHVPAALVRLFAIGRTTARYGERLVGHKAALADQVTRRIGLFAAMAAAPAVRRMGWQFGNQDRLADYLDDVEDVDYARLRAGLPALTLALGFAALFAASAIVAPLSLLPISIFSLVLPLMGRRVKRAGAMAWGHARSQRRGGAERLGAAMASAVGLKAEGAWNDECRAAVAALSRADAEALALRRLQSGFDLVVAIFGPVSGISVVAAAWVAGLRGQELLPPVFVAFAWLALGEAMNGASRIVVADLRRHAAQAEIGKWMRSVAAAPDQRVQRAAPRSLCHARLLRRSPDGRPLGTFPLALDLQAGRPTFLVGTSGSGKTSLLKQIAGWIGRDVFICGRDTLWPSDRQVLSMLCLHDAAVVDDTIRANLFAAGLPDATLWQALDAVELTERVGLAGGLDAWIVQAQLSLGEAQRLNLARAWLSDKPVVLLDEPGEHLDDEQGQRIVKRLLDRLSDRILVVSTHRAPASRVASVVALKP